MKKIVVTLSDEGMQLEIEEIESPMEAMWLLEVARDEIKASVGRKQKEEAGPPEERVNHGS